LDEALRLFEQALKLDPMHPGAAYNRGVLLLREGRASESEILGRLNESKRARPADWAPSFLLGLMHLRRRDSPAALSELEEASFLSRDNALIQRAQRRAKGARDGSAELELFVDLPRGSELTLSDESAFKALLERVEKQLASGSFAKAYESLRKARSMQGFEQAQAAMDLLERLSLKGARSKLKAAWQKRLLDGSGGASAACFLPEGRIFSAHADKTVRLWDASGELIWSQAGHAAPVRAVCAAHDGKSVLSASADGTMRLWDADTGACVRAFVGHAGAVNSVCASANGKVLSGSDDKTLKLWDLARGKLERSIPAHEGAVSAASLSADGSRAVSGGADKTLKVWDIVKGQTLKVLEGHDLAVRAARLSPDGRKALSGAEDKALRSWSLDTGQSQQTMNHFGAVRSACFSPEGRFALSAGDDKILRLWDLDSGKQSWSFEGHGSGISSVDISPQARYAASAGADGIRVWELDWEYVFPEPADWAEGAKPHADYFLAGFKGRKPSGKGPIWTEEEFQGFLVELSRRGLGWLTPEGVRSWLEALAQGKAAPGLKETAVASTFSKEQAEKAAKRRVLQIGAVIGSITLLLLGLLFLVMKPDGVREPERRGQARPDFRMPQAPSESKPASAQAPILPLPAKEAESAKTSDSAKLENMKLIPAGEFLMGSPKGEGGADEHPQHKVYLDSYYMDQYEVTVPDYAACVEEGKCRAPGTVRNSEKCNFGRTGREKHPINCVDWESAKAYCEWAGKRLPTEAEWEKAARGPQARRYPWGDKWDWNKPNTASKWAGRDLKGVEAWKKYFYQNTKGKAYLAAQTDSVGNHPADQSLYGMYDMGGNVSEWTADWYDEDYYRTSPSRNPKGPELPGAYNKDWRRVTRGASWFVNVGGSRAAGRARLGPGDRNVSTGFRCALGVSEGARSPEIAPEASENAPGARSASAAGGAGIEWVAVRGGSFMMGSASGSADEKPVHRVTLRSFELAKTEVTVAQYKACVDAGACAAPGKGLLCNWGVSGREKDPLNCVDWNQAKAFSEWVGGRLPSEAEWEYAARSGGRDIEYPWGDEEATCSRAVIYDGGAGCGRVSTWPVCSKPEGNTRQGLCDMA
ncbi:MAG: SUMF1/EgtB/PvdO family nonheme iron enzyme, partial [Elusimicrobiota bacterium]